MKRITVRLTAAALAVGITVLELTGIAWIAAGTFAFGAPVMALPSAVVPGASTAPARITVLATGPSLPPR